jgi:hypothetical protein
MAWHSVVIMAQTLTYASLLTDLQAYLERNDATTINQIPRGIMYAENSLANRLKILGVQNSGTFTIPGSANALPKPARWRRTKDMSITVGTQTFPVLLRDIGYCLNYSSGTAPQRPQYYCDLDYATWFFSPTTDQSYSALALWYERVQPLDNANQQNFWTDNAPTALLYECLMQMVPFLKNDDRLQMIKGIADEEMQMLRDENKLLIADRQAIIPDD